MFQTSLNWYDEDGKDDNECKCVRERTQESGKIESVSSQSAFEKYSSFK